MERKLKRTAAAGIIAMTAVAAMPFVSVNAYAETDSFLTAVDVDGLLIDKAAVVTVEQENAEELNVTIASALDYSSDELSAFTNTDGNPFVISCQDAYGIKYNPDTTVVMSYCDEYDKWGDLKIRRHESDDYLGETKTGKKRIYWECNADCLQAGTGLFGCRILLSGDDGAEVEIFGRKYTLTAETADAPVMFDTADIEPVVPETAPPAPMPVLSNISGFGTELETMETTNAVHSEKPAETSETAVTTTDTTVTVTETTAVMTEMPVQTVSETVQTISETFPVMPAVQETETTVQTETISVQPTEQEWKVIQVTIPDENTEETADTETSFPIIPTIAGNVAAILIGFLVKIKFF